MGRLKTTLLIRTWGYWWMKNSTWPVNVGLQPRKSMVSHQKNGQQVKGDDSSTLLLWYLTWSTAFTSGAPGTRRPREYYNNNKNFFWRTWQAKVAEVFGLWKWGPRTICTTYVLQPCSSGLLTTEILHVTHFTSKYNIFLEESKDLQLLFNLCLVNDSYQYFGCQWRHFVMAKSCYDQKEIGDQCKTFLIYSVLVLNIT